MEQTHVHVYKVEKMMEFDFDTIDEEKARADAIELFKKEPDNNLKDSDCKFIAISFITEETGATTE
jgi:hypothetical protein